MAINREASHPQGQFSKLYPVEFPPTYAELQNKCGDVMKQCCALNAEIFVLAEKVMALNWDASFGSRYQPAKNSLPLYTPLQDVRQPNIDTSDLGVLHRKRYDPRIYASRGQQRFPSPPSPPPVIPPFQAHEPLYYSRSRSPRQPSVPQRDDSSYTLHPLSQNASRIDTPVFGVMPQTPRSASSYVPTVEPRSSRTPPVPKHTRAASQSSGQINNLYPKSGTQPRASMSTPRTFQNVPTNLPSAAQQRVPQSRSQSEQRAQKVTSATSSVPPRPSHSSVPRTHQHPTPTKPSSPSPPFAASSSSPMADNNRLGTHSAPLVDTVSRGPNSASSSSVPVQTVDTQRLDELKDLLENGPKKSDPPGSWRFECHGLHNPHNMCFRNAALQGLVHTSEFAQLFLQLGEVLKRDEFIHVAPLVHATVDFIRMFYHKAGTNRDPQHNFWVNKDVTVGHPLEPSTKLFAALTAAMPDLFKATPITVEQGENLVMQSEEDSGEFLMSYFNKLNFEFDLIGRVLRSPAWRPSSSQLAKDYMRNPKQTSIYRLFGAAISERVHFVMTIPIDKSVVDVADCLRLYFQHLPEPAYFEQLPSVLVLNLGRFVFGSRGGVQTTFKELKMIKIPQVLTIPEALISSYFQLPSIVNYRLFAVVYHHGPTAVTGHYTADAAHPGYRLHHHRARDEKDTRPWFRANDTSVSHLQATEVYRTPDCPDGKPSTKTPFVLFYEQIPA